MTNAMKPGEWGTRDGKLAIIWHRPGVAALGEPSMLLEVRTYASEEERFDAYCEIGCSFNAKSNVSKQLTNGAN